jgi:hypothetical protein
LRLPSLLPDDLAAELLPVLAILRRELTGFGHLRRGSHHNERRTAQGKTALKSATSEKIAHRICSGSMLRGWNGAVTG